MDHIPPQACYPAAMLLLALITSLHATQVGVDRVPCPVGTGSARVFERIASDTHGGWDSDLVSYSTQGQWRSYAISTCPDSLYSVYGKDMDRVPDSQQAAAMLSRLGELRKELPPADDLEVWDRYYIAGEMYKIMGKDGRFLAQLYLEASWTARDEAVGVYAGLEGPMAARNLLDAGEKELLKSMPDHQRKILLHNLARVAHRGGFATERDRYLELFEQVGGLDADEARVLRRFRSIVNEVEPRFQRLAVQQLRSWLLTQPDDPTELMRATYLLADLARRLGEEEEAIKGYALVAVSEASPQELRELSAYLGSQMEPAQ